jgi:hypothetical protein
MTDVAPSPSVPPEAQTPAPPVAKPAGRTTVARQRLAQHIQPADVTRGFAVRAADVWRQHRMEAIAVVLLALAGLTFPPTVIWPVGLLLWLIGLGFALTSKLWDPIDKWVGSVGPLVLVIVGTALSVSADGKRSSASAYGHEAMNVAVTLFRIGILLAAVYLAWRIPRGPRTATPPWVRRRR